MDFIQLREKDLSTGELEGFARDAVRVVREARTKTRLLINSRTDIAVASLADGVHLRSDDVCPEEVRAAFQSCKHVQSGPGTVIGVSCHKDDEVKQAGSAAATFAVFGPVFEKQGSRAAGWEMLGRVCRHKIPVLALGGVTPDNFEACLSAGASGIAGIRLFQQGDLAQTVARMRKSHP